MAGASLLTLLDDIASILDDVAVLSKTALKKTSGVLGDDLALNAEQVSGVRAERELAVVWAVAKGSLVNKLILVPAALLISAFIPWLITPLLMLGGAYLCYEGTEKVLHHWFHKEQHRQHRQRLKEAVENPEIDLAELEKEKIKGAIRTDFILSAEIIVIVLGTVQTEPFFKQSIVVSFIALAITIFVYGLVAGIVKLDDIGLHLLQQQGVKIIQRVKRSIGSGLLWFAPRLMKLLTIVGTIAMFLVGGGIIIHGIHLLAEWQSCVVDWFTTTISITAYVSWLISLIYTLVMGFIFGAIIIPMVQVVSFIERKMRKS